MTSVLVICPSINPSHARRFCAAVTDAVARGADIRGVLVANSSTTQQLAEEWPTMVLRGTNGGFSESVNRGAAHGGPARWVVIANDDLELVGETFLDVMAHLDEVGSAPRQIIRLNREPWRPLPGAWGVFANLSLAEKAYRGVGGRIDRSATQSNTYPSFDFVAISNDLWTANGGMDEAFPFCYEDAWFVRQAQESGEGLALSSADIPVHHATSSTTASKIDVVLPVIVWSGMTYLERIGVSRTRARVICFAALALRLPLSLAARADTRPHISGIGRSLVALIRMRQPRLAPPALAGVTVDADEARA